MLYIVEKVKLYYNFSVTFSIALTKSKTEYLFRTVSNTIMCMNGISIRISIRISIIIAL